MEDGRWRKMGGEVEEERRRVEELAKEEEEETAEAKERRHTVGDSVNIPRRTPRWRSL